MNSLAKAISYLVKTPGEDLGSDKSFGLGVAITLFCITLYAFLKESQLWWKAWLTLSILVSLLVICSPTLLHPLNVLLYRLRRIVNTLTAPIFLGVLFFTIITPIGLLLRLLGRRPLGLERDMAATTYWKVSAVPEHRPESFKNQF